MEEEIVLELKKSENSIEAAFAIASALEAFKIKMMDQLWDSLSGISGYRTQEDWTKAEEGISYRREGWILEITVPIGVEGRGEGR